MGRAIGAVVLGLAVYGLCWYVFIRNAFGGMQPDGVFAAGTYTFTYKWMMIVTVIGIAAACGAGRLCRMAAKASKPVHVLAILCAVLGLGYALYNLLQPDSGPRVRVVTMWDLVEKTVGPAWFLFVQPMVGYFFVRLAGGTIPMPPFLERILVRNPSSE